MATLNSSDRLTAAEVTKRSGVSEDSRRILEELAKTNQMLLDAPIVEANDGTVHTHLVRTALPTPTRRVYNQGVGSSASQTKTIHDVMTQIAIYSKVDADLIKKAAHPQELLMSENAAFIQAMGLQQAEDIFYGNHDVDRANMDGFAKRRASLDELCISAGGTGSALTSIYLVKWGQNFCKYIYPRGSSGLGVNRTDKGIQTITAPTGSGEMEAYVNYYTADYGLTVGMEKSLIRICNIDLTASDIGTTVIKAILKAKSKLAPGDGTVSILCNSDVMSLFDIATLDKSNVVYTAEDPWGREVNKIRDMRLRQCDALLNTESQVTA